MKTRISLIIVILMIITVNCADAQKYIKMTHKLSIGPTAYIFADAKMPIKSFGLLVEADLSDRVSVRGVVAPPSIHIFDAGYYSISMFYALKKHYQSLIYFDPFAEISYNSFPLQHWTFPDIFAEGKGEKSKFVKGSLGTRFSIRVPIKGHIYENGWTISFEGSYKFNIIELSRPNDIKMTGVFLSLNARVPIFFIRN